MSFLKPEYDAHSRVLYRFLATLCPTAREGDVVAAIEEVWRPLLEQEAPPADGGGSVLAVILRQGFLVAAHGLPRAREPTVPQTMRAPARSRRPTLARMLGAQWRGLAAQLPFEDRARFYLARVGGLTDSERAAVVGESLQAYQARVLAITARFGELIEVTFADQRHFAEALEILLYLHARGGSAVDVLLIDRLSDDAVVAALRAAGLADTTLAELMKLARAGAGEQPAPAGVVMISYATPDRTEARKLRDRLEKRGVKVWLDVDHIVGRAPVYRVLCDVLANATDILVLCGAEVGYWQDVEIGTALAQRKDRPLGILPVLLVRERLFRRVHAPLATFFYIRRWWNWRLDTILQWLRSDRNHKQGVST
jgi:hypothetical protein